VSLPPIKPVAQESLGKESGNESILRGDDQMKIRIMMIIGVIFLCLGPVSLCGAQTTTFGGEPNGVMVVQELTLHQHGFEKDGATDLHFKVWQKEDNIEIRGWEITISHFTDSASKRGDQPDSAPQSPHATLVNIPGVPPTTNPDNGQHAVDVEAKFRDPVGQVPYCTFIKIKVTLWLTSYNTIRMADCLWTSNGATQPATEDFGWEIGFPSKVASSPGKYQHTLKITNDGSTPFALANVQAVASAIDYNDSTDVSFAGALQSPDRTLKGAEPLTVTNIQTDGEFLGKFIYHTFAIGQFPGDPNALVVRAKHVVVPSPVKIPTLSQWGLIVMVLLIAGAGAVMIVRWRRLSTT
jgi:hypothetical protein